MITKYFKSIKDTTLKEISDFRAGCWIHVNNASKEDIAMLSQITDLSVDDLIDSLDELELPRIERQKNNILIFIRMPVASSGSLYTETLTIILTENFLITISLNKSSVLDSLLKEEINFATTQKSKFLLNIFLKVTLAFTKKIKKVRTSVTLLKKDLKKVTNSEIVSLTEYEEILSQYISALVPMRNVFESILSGEYVKLFEEDNNLLNDLFINTKQSVDICNVSLKSITSLRDSYQIIFTNDLNKEIKLLTALTIIFTVPNIVSSIYGMNVSLPFEKDPHAFAIVVSFAFVTSILILLLFRIKKWM